MSRLQRMISLRWSLPDFKAGQKIKIISPEGFLVGVVESLKDKEALFSEGNPEDKVFKELESFFGWELKNGRKTVRAGLSDFLRINKIRIKYIEQMR